MTKITLENVRLGAWPVLWEARDYQNDGNFNFSAKFHIPKNSPAAKLLLDTYQQVATEEWKEKAGSVLQQLKGNNLKTFITDGDLFAEKEAHSGHYIISSKRPKSDGRPDVRDRNKQPLAQEDGKPYGGCYVRAILDVWAQDNQYGKGMRCKLLGVQFVKDGDAFAGTGSSASEDDFADLGDGEDAPELGAATGTGGYV